MKINRAWFLALALEAEGGTVTQIKGSGYEVVGKDPTYRYYISPTGILLRHGTNRSTAVRVKQSQFQELLLAGKAIYNQQQQAKQDALVAEKERVERLTEYQEEQGITIPWPDGADGPVSILSPAGRARFSMLEAMARQERALGNSGQAGKHR